MDEPRPDEPNTDRPPDQPRIDVEAPRWGLIEALLIGLLFILLMYMAVLAARMLRLERLLGPAGLLALLPLADVLLCVIIWRLMVFLGHKPAALGLHAEGLGRRLIFSLAVYAVVLPAIFATQYATIRLLEFSGIPEEALPRHALFDAFPGRPGVGTIVLLYVYAALVRPFIEELCFRGLLYPALRRHMGTGAAVVVNALLFGMLHFTQPQSMPALIVIGLLLAALYARTRSLPAVFAVHAAHNALVVTLFVVKMLSAR